jgi:hypothetical protein
MNFIQFLEQAAVILLYNINTWKVVKCDAGEVWRNNLIDHVRNKEVLLRARRVGAVISHK